MKKFLAKVGRAILVVIHDPEVERAGKGLAVLVVIRLLIVFGASAQVIELVQRALGA